MKKRLQKRGKRIDEKGYKIALNIRFFIFLLTLSTFLIFLSFIKEKGEIIVSEGFNYTITGCEKESHITREYEKGIGEVKIKAEADSIILEHKLSYVCCADLKVDMKRDGNIITVTEINEGEMCRCICDYSIDAMIGPLSNDNYTLKLYGVAFEEIKPELISEQKAEIKESLECLENDDCIKVQTTCCSCNMGGEEVCVAKSKAEEIKAKNCAENLMCIALYNCKIESCVCRKGKCEAVTLQE